MGGFQIIHILIFCDVLYKKKNYLRKGLMSRSISGLWFGHRSGHLQLISLRAPCFYCREFVCVTLLYETCTVSKIRKIWRFPDVAGTNPVCHLQVVLVVWQNQTWWPVVLLCCYQLGSTKPPAHPENRDRVCPCDDGKTSHRDAAVRPRKFHCILS